MCIVNSLTYANSKYIQLNQVGKESGLTHNVRFSCIAVLYTMVFSIFMFGGAATSQGAQAASGDWVASVGLGWSDDEEVRGISVEGARIVDVWLGAPRAATREIGFYGSAGMPTSVWESRTTTSFNDYWYLNAGMTYSMNDNFLVYAGPGFAYQRVRGRGYAETVHRTRPNANVGIILQFTEQIGLNLGYNLTPNSISLGLTINSSTFQ